MSKNHHVVLAAAASPSIFGLLGSADGQPIAATPVVILLTVQIFSLIYVVRNYSSVEAESITRSQWAQFVIVPLPSIVLFLFASGAWAVNAWALFIAMLVQLLFIAILYAKYLYNLRPTIGDDENTARSLATKPPGSAVGVILVGVLIGVALAGGLPPDHTTANEIPDTDELSTNSNTDNPSTSDSDDLLSDNSSAFETKASVSDVEIVEQDRFSIVLGIHGEVEGDVLTIKTDVRKIPYAVSEDDFDDGPAEVEIYTTNEDADYSSITVQIENSSQVLYEDVIETDLDSD